MRNYAISAVCVVFVGAFAFFASRGRLVKFNYTRMIDNQALSNPIKVVRVAGTQIMLTDGRMIELDEPLGDRWNRLLKAGSMVEIDAFSGDDYLAMWGNEPRSICGGTYAFTIPLFPYDADSNRRSMIGFGSFARKPNEKAEQAAPSEDKKTPD